MNHAIEWMDYLCIMWNFGVGESFCCCLFLPQFSFRGIFAYTHTRSWIAYNVLTHLLISISFSKRGFQFFAGGKAGCSMQRIVSLKPDHFSKHMVYHTSNNKQKAKWPVKSDRIIKANDFLGHVNTVRKNAIRKKKMVLVNLKKGRR